MYLFYIFSFFFIIQHEDNKRAISSEWSELSVGSVGKKGKIQGSRTMAWETRGGHSYYYRKKRMGNKVLSEYVGKGLVAQEIASKD